jgi:hypothetical protein
MNAHWVYDSALPTHKTSSFARIRFSCKPDFTEQARSDLHQSDKFQDEFL